MALLKLLQQRFNKALAELVPDPAPYAVLVKPAQDSLHGDYQANCAMPLAKVLGKQPRTVAQEIVDRLPLGDLLEKPEIAGPGFINLRLKAEWLAGRVQQMARSERLGVEPAVKPRTIVVDYSSPNVAKPMHVGHLRSTIIGAALARLLRFLGHRVITDNHLGDWGSQFGMLLYGYKHFRNEEALRADPVRELARIYIHVRSLMKKDEDADTAGDPVADAARQETVKLHAGDPENVAVWRQFMPACLEEIETIYRRLDVHFDHTHGESFYQPMLAGVVQSLLDKGLARVGDQGAIVIGNDDPPAIVRKKDGAFTYTTSDLATIQYRMEHWQPDAILYVVGAPQALHFKNLFAAARLWGYDKVELTHIAFGSVLGADRKTIRTREGGAIELGTLLDEAVEHGARKYEETSKERLASGQESPNLTDADLRSIAEVVGLGAVKYADLSQNRTTDYVFSWDKMLATDGNTSTYMQYAYARIRSVFRKGEEEPERYRANPPLPKLAASWERDLALQLLRLGDALESAAADYKPNVLTAYLWDLAKSYSGFYQNCPVLKAETPELRQSRLLLCDLTARVIRQGLCLLGIQVVERM
jgi:arginyl-tRNA synthetase